MEWRQRLARKAHSSHHQVFRGNARPDGLDAANISFNLLKVSSGGGVTLGPILLGVAKPAHILTQSATVRRVVNMTALTVVDCLVHR